MRVREPVHLDVDGLREPWLVVGISLIVHKRWGGEGKDVSLEGLLRFEGRVRGGGTHLSSRQLISSSLGMAMDLRRDEPTKESWLAEPPRTARPRDRTHVIRRFSVW